MTNEASPFVIKQLEEALEERQGTDRRKDTSAESWPKSSERRSKDRRKLSEEDSK